MASHRCLLFLLAASPLLFLTATNGQGDTASSGSEESPATQEEMWALMQETARRLGVLESMNEMLSRHLLQQQLYIEEKTKSAGDSGIKAERTESDGPKSYYAGSISIGHVHNHPEFPRTMGMGELHMSMNGVEYRTRHNDYTLVMPSTSGTEYRATEEVPFPDVPPEVTSKPTVQEEIAEMRKWFKAWRDADYSVRDYRPYFKPVLCYLEGAWTTDRPSEFTEPFFSARHYLDASSWDDLHQKAVFESGTGIHYDSENLAFLPTKFFNGTDGKLYLAQWNYRILCHPIKQSLQPQQLKTIDDLGARLSRRKTFEKLENTKQARFRVTEQEEDDFYNSGSPMDKIMQEVPGLDNYPANITDNFQDLTKYDLLTGAPLNVGYYHLWYKEGDRGNKILRRGFHDRNLFVAETTQERVAPFRVEMCITKWNGNVVCEFTEKRVSYAIPLEILYLTPLNAWNPYNLQYKGDASSPEGLTVEADGRKGQPTKEQAFNGTNYERYFQTPAHFFTGSSISNDVSSEVESVVGVLDRDGEVRQMVASGQRVFLPPIAGVGHLLRTRYPVMPLYDEGSLAWKELEAVRDVLMDLEGYQNYLHHIPAAFNASFIRIVTADSKTLVTASALSEEAGYHHHLLMLTPKQYVDLVDNKKILLLPTMSDSELTHFHMMEVRFFKDEWKIISCDGNFRCPHEHGKYLFESADAEAMA